MPLVSVVIPTHNRAHVLGRALNSVISQSLQDFEIIVVDDASKDETEDLVRSFRDDRIQYVRHETNRGAPAARNTGIKSASGKYVAFLDSDDEWLPNKLEVQINTFRTSDLPQLGVLTCPTYTRFAGRQKLRAPKAMQFSRGWIHKDLIRNRGVPWQTSSLVVLRDALTDDKLFDESLPSVQDWDFLLRLSKDWQIESIHYPLLIRYISKGGRISGNGSDLEASKRIIEKYHDVFAETPELMARRYRGLARRYFRVGDLENCRATISKALKYNRRFIGLRVLYGLTYIPVLRASSAYRAIRTVRRRLRLLKY